MDDFAALILTHGRPDRVYTYRTLRSHGYTGRIVIVIDDEDKTADQYRALYGDQVEMFSKSEIAKTFDEADNFNDRRAIIYARNASFDIARRIGVRYFIQLDDDYTAFRYRFNKRKEYDLQSTTQLDQVFSVFLSYLKATPFASVAMAQGGDHLGGGQGSYAKKIFAIRKAMNSFFCDVERPFQFHGRINEDVNTYTAQQRAGLPFLTVLGFSLEQKTTQSNAGGMTELYLDSGTYVKSFYSVLMAPSAVSVRVMRSRNGRLHHSINWKACAPQIIRETHRKLRVEKNEAA
jgi:hypothetical protein